MKSFFFLLKVFMPNIIKLFFAVGIILIAVFRKKIFSITNKTINTIFAIVCLIVCIICIYCIYSTIVKIINIYENQYAENNVLRGSCKTIKISVSDICELVEQNDVIEIMIYQNEQKIFIGSSSNHRAGSSVFFDKRYYINGTDYLTFEGFHDALIKCSQTGFLNVVYIDNLDPEKYGFPDNTGENNTGDGSLCE